MLRALQNVVPSHLMDRGLYDFAAVRATGRPEAEGDLAFDDEPLTMPDAHDATDEAPMAARRIVTLTPQDA
jgi:tRNA 2-thiocytidine biosynthesis protein TtcA